MELKNNILNSHVTRRGVIKTGAVGGVFATASGLTLPFNSKAVETENNAPPLEDKVVWSSCTVNCRSRCLLRLHVRDNEVYWVESDNTGADEYGEHQVRACLRGRSIRRRMNHPDRLKYPMKRVGLRGEGKFERISWEEAPEFIID